MKFTSLDTFQALKDKFQKFPGDTESSQIEPSDSIFIHGEKSLNLRRRRVKQAQKLQKYRLGRYTTGKDKPFYETDTLGTVSNQNQVYFSLFKLFLTYLSSFRCLQIIFTNFLGYWARIVQFESQFE